VLHELFSNKHDAEEAGANEIWNALMKSNGEHYIAISSKEPNQVLDGMRWQDDSSGIKIFKIRVNGEWVNDDEATRNFYKNG
jgi:hypothetical protein